MLFYLQVHYISLPSGWMNDIQLLLDMLKSSTFLFFFLNQALLVGLSSVMVLLSTSHRTQNQELHVLHQLINWSIAGTP